MDSYPHTSSLTCTLCSCHFKDPRFLPCRHTFCFACLKTLCDSTVAAASDATKAKIFCPLCKVQATVPINGADGFQIDEKTQALKDKIVQEIVDNITRSMSNSRDSTASPRLSTSATNNNSTPFSSRDRERPSRFSGQSDFSSGADKTSYGGTASGNNSGSDNDSYSSIYGGYGKYAKYFESADKEGNNGVNFKPTIRPDHTRVGYESSIRFRNKQMNSKERNHDEERDLRRRTWYGSTLHSRRTQSLNRSTYGNMDESNVRSSENLFKINEDRENVQASEEPSMSHDQATPQRFKNSSFNTPRMTPHGLNTSTPINSDNSKSDSYHSAIFETPNSSDRSGEKSFFSTLGSDNRRSNLTAGPPRPTLPTHRENITSDGPFIRQNSKDRKSSKSSNKSPEHKISFRTRKQSPKGSSSNSSSSSFREKKTKSPLPSPRRRRKSSDKSPSYETTNIPESDVDARKIHDNENKFNRETPTRPRQQQNEPPTSPTFHQEKQENITQKMRERINPERRAKTARDRLSFNFDLGSRDENVKQQHQQQSQHEPQYQQRQPSEPYFSDNYDHYQHRQQPPQQHFHHQQQQEEHKSSQPFERVSRVSRFEQQSQQQSYRNDHLHSRRRKPRCNSVGAQFSLNKNDFKTDQDFKEHLLGMTMTKDQYDRIMDDVRNERDRLDSTGSHENDDLNYEDDDVSKGDGVGAEDIKCGDGDVGDEKENEKTTLKVDENEAEEKTDPSKKHEPLIDENLLSSFRTKYSSALEIKRFPNQSTFPELCEEVTKCWSCQKNDFGVPTAAAFLKTDSLVVADFGLSCLEFFDSGGHLEHTLTGIKPFGVTSYNNGGNIIVGDRKSKSLRIFDEFGTDVSQIDNLGSLEWLSGLAVGRDGNLIMSDRSRCKIIVSNIGGEIINEFGSYGSGAKQLCMADFLTVDSKNRIIVCDSGNHCLKIFDSNGNPISTVGSRGNSDGLFEWPKGVAVDENDNILVADTMNHRVSLFSPDGVFVKHLLTSIPDPYNLTWFNNRLAVLHYNLKGMSQYDVYNYKYCRI